MLEVAINTILLVFKNSVIITLYLYLGSKKRANILLRTIRLNPRSKLGFQRLVTDEIFRS